MKLAIIGSVGVPAAYGGFETLVEYLLDDIPQRTTVYCSGLHYKQRLKTYKSAKLVYIPLNANGPMSILYDILSVMHAVLTGHRHLLILGTSGAVIIPLIRVLCPWVQIVTNIDGIEWRRDKWRGLAKWYLRFSESLAVKYSSVVVADNQAIADYAEKIYGRSCSIIAYGGDHALIDLKARSAYLDLHINRPYAFSVCRIEPENNVHTILQAFCVSGEPLVFVGNWEASDYGRQLLSEYSTVSNMTLLNPVYDIETLCAYRSYCRAYIHGHSAGGTNPSLVEMMHFAKPVIAYDCGYNRASMENKGAYFSDSDELVMRYSEVIGDRDSDMLEIAQRRYTWHSIRSQYWSLFN